MDLICTTYIPSGKSCESSMAESVLQSKMPKWCYETTTLCDVSTKNIVLFSSAYPLHILAACKRTGSERVLGLPGHTFAGGHGISSSNAGNTINQTFGSLRGGLDFGKSLNSTNDGYFVFVADLNTPWDITLVTSRPTEITALSWDLETSEAFVLADSEGNIETWHMKNSVITEWNRAAHQEFPSEQFLKAKFIHDGRRICVNLDKQDSIYFREKFLFRNAPEISQDFNEQNVAACLLISSTGLAVVIAYCFDDQLQDVSSTISAPANNLSAIVGSRRVLSCTQSLGPIRGRVRQVDISFNKDGQLLVATSNGDPKCPIRMFSLVPRLEDDLCGDESLSSGAGDMLNKILLLDVFAFPGIFIKSSINSQDTEKGPKVVASSSTTSAPNTTDDEVPSNEIEGNSHALNSECLDVCQAVVDLCFVVCDDNSFAILIATQHPSGGRVELWELKETQLTTHKIFLSAEGSQQNCPKNIVPVWQYQEVFVAGSSSAQVVKMSTPHSSFQTGRAAACYVTIAYTDGCIQCLLRDSLQQIGCVDIPKSGNPQATIFQEDAYPHSGPSAAKIPRVSSTVAICDTTFTANGNVLVAVDSLGQLYLYRMSPISDPGGPHVPDSVALMLAKCLMSGYDWWDINVCCAGVSLAGTKCIQGQTSGSASLTPIDAICEKLTDDFHRQPAAIQSYYLNRFMSIKTSIYRLTSTGTGGASSTGALSEYKAADCYIHSMLLAVHGAFKSLLRPVAIDINSNDTAFDKVSKLLTGKMKDEISVDKLATLLGTRLHEFTVEPQTLQSFHQLVQWITDLCLNLCASIPELKARSGQNNRANALCGPGASLISNINVLTMLRELLLLIRLWGKNMPAIRPVYTKTSADDTFDLLSKLFHMITKLITNPNNLEDTLVDEAALLPNHVMIPPMHYSSAAARGIAPALTSGHGKCPISYEFGCEPQQDAFSLENTCGSGYGGLGVSPVIWSSISGAVDCVKNMYLGRCPFSVKRCTRCHGLTTPTTNIGNNASGGTNAKQAGSGCITKGWDHKWLRHCPCGGPWKIEILNNH